MEWPLKIIIALLIANLAWSYYLKKEILNPKRYYLVDDSHYTTFITHIEGNGTLSHTRIDRPRWRLPDAKKAKEVYPHLKIIDCATWEEVEE